MRLWPRSLLWRSVLLIALLLVVANLAWLQIFRVTERAPRARQTAQQIASVVNITRWALITADPAKRFELLPELSQTKAYRSTSPSRTSGSSRCPTARSSRKLAGELNRQLGPDTQVTLSRDGVPACG